MFGKASGLIILYLPKIIHNTSVCIYSPPHLHTLGLETQTIKNSSSRHEKPHFEWLVIAIALGYLSATEGGSLLLKHLRIQDSDGSRWILTWKPHCYSLASLIPEYTVYALQGGKQLTVLPAVAPWAITITSMARCVERYSKWHAHVGGTEGLKATQQEVNHAGTRNLPSFLRLVRSWLEKRIYYSHLARVV